MEATTELVMLTAQAVAETHGLAISNAKLIGGYSNTMIKLDPLPLVARIATITAMVRANDDCLSREVEVARFLARHMSGTARPSDLLSPGPHKRNGMSLSFWEFLDIGSAPIPITPIELGRHLRALHGTLSRCPIELPTLGPIEEIWRILERDELSSKLDSTNREAVAESSGFVRRQLDQMPINYQPLHGDAHYGNLWRTPTGPVWGDFEDVCLGPIEWDLACMIASSQVLGTGSAAKIALRAYGAPFDQDLLNLLVIARTLQAIAWALVVSPEPMANPRFCRRLEWLSHP